MSTADGTENRHATGASTPLSAAQLITRCDPASLGFDTTAELPDSLMPDGGTPFGQARAVDAIELALAVRGPGFHLFVAGEMTAGILNTVHNVFFYLDTMRRVRDAIAFGTFDRFRQEFRQTFSSGALNA